MAAAAVKGGDRWRQIEIRFEWAFGLGALLIVALKALISHPIWGGVLAGGCGIGVMYLYLVRNREKRSPKELPRLGDEVYYLGLLYTLISLCFALVQLFLFPDAGGDVAQRTDQLIGSFGIALMTTIAGIVLRTPLQGRYAEAEATVIRIPGPPVPSTRERPGDGSKDLDHDPETARSEWSTRVWADTDLDLERYAYALRREMQSATNAFNSFANQVILQAGTVRSHLEDMVRAFRETLEVETQRFYEELAGRNRNVQENLETSLGGAAEAFASVRDEVISGGSAAREQMEAMATATQERLGELAAAAQQDLEARATTFREDLQRTTGAEVGRLGAAYRGLADAAEEARRGAEGHQQRIERVLGALESQLTNLGGSIERIRRGSGETAEHLRGIGTELRSVVENLAELTHGRERHGQALEAAVGLLNRLVESAGRGLESQERLEQATGRIGDFAAAAKRHAEAMKQSEAEMGTFKAGLTDLHLTLRSASTRLAQALTVASEALENAQRHAREDRPQEGWFRRRLRSPRGGGAR